MIDAENTALAVHNAPPVDGARYRFGVLNDVHGLTFACMIEVVSHPELSVEIECVIDPESELVDQIRVLSLCWPLSGWEWDVPSRLQDVEPGSELMSWAQHDDEIAEIVETMLADMMPAESSLWRAEP